jgi:hypothetical protein
MSRSERHYNLQSPKTPSNNRVEHAHGVRSTHNGEAPLFAAHAER